MLLTLRRTVTLDTSENFISCVPTAGEASFVWPVWSNAEAIAEKISRHRLAPPSLLASGVSAREMRIYGNIALAFCFLGALYCLLAVLLSAQPDTVSLVSILVGCAICIPLAQSMRR